MSAVTQRYVIYQRSPTTAKRLGDGYYEQRLIREQVVALTGQRYLDGYTSDEQQFKALMDQGITFGKQYALKSGVALTPEQMALLTGDIVWLVNTTVTMPDGSQQTVLVPQVYAKVKPGDLDGSGALIAGNNVNIKLDGDLFNSGTLNGRRVLQLDADTITNQTGTLSGDDVRLNARNDINNIRAAAACRRWPGGTSASTTSPPPGRIIWCGMPTTPSARARAAAPAAK